MSSEIEISLRLAFFVGVLIIMATWEILSPRRQLTTKKSSRWASNLGLVALNSVVSRLVVPVSAVSIAVFAESRQCGLLHQVAWPDWTEFLLAIVALDLAIYLQHVLFHAVPIFWRLHRVHHADLDLDVTSGNRFHTIEILISAFIKLAAVLIIGPSAVAVVTFEILLNATSMFNHSNVYLPGWIDQVLRYVIVTPDMHRVHHSIDKQETNSNFGFSLSWWDLLLGTYQSQPNSGHTAMTLGLVEWRNERDVTRLDRMLLIPFREQPDDSVRETGADSVYKNDLEPIIRKN
jgi:sterol desaturase/sphingolipid hydroxylase (fatty acid hydroxylase superfamily)